MHHPAAAMDLGLSERVRPLLEQVRAMVRDEIMPLDEEYEAELQSSSNRFVPTKRMVEILETLKAKAKAKGLWNFWLTGGDHGHALTTVEYAYLAEEMGWSHLAPEVFNCSAPDTGNMEVLERMCTPEQRKPWLADLMEGKTRSAYLMTEPYVASSDATNISLEAKQDGDHYMLNGEKWWASGAGDPRCVIYIVMTRSDPTAAKHAQHTQFLVPANTPGIKVLRPMQVFGHDDAPHGHMHIRFTNVRVPAANIILGPGRGFEVAQGRLGPGRIHHCMRSIGQAERALQIMCQRAVSREAFGRPIAELGGNYDVIADARTDIEMARLLCLKAAWMMDHKPMREAAIFISQIKVAAPKMALKITDDAIQMHGAAGISQDFPLARMYTGLRTMRLVDGPDAVHRRQVARNELKPYSNRVK